MNSPTVNFKNIMFYLIHYNTTLIPFSNNFYLINETTKV